jgi:hypothetical protein
MTTGRHKAESSSFLRTFFIGLVLILSGILIGVLTARLLPLSSTQNLPPSTSMPTTYEECLEDPGSRVQESYPATCITAAGVSFIQPIPTASISADPTINWVTYTNSGKAFSFKYPESWSQEGSSTSGRIVVGPALSGMKTYSLTVETLTNPKKLTAQDYVAKLINDTKGKPGELVFDSQENITFAGQPGIKLNNVFAFDQSLEKIYITYNNFLYLIDYPTKTENPNLLDPIQNYDVVQLILTTFNFLNSPSSAGYKCPANGWVDCMPVMDEAKKKACSPEAMNWYKNNCPNFQGGAL